MRLGYGLSYHFVQQLLSPDGVEGATFATSGHDIRSFFGDQSPESYVFDHLADQVERDQPAAAQGVHFQNLPFGQPIFCTPDSEGVLHAMPINARLTTASLHFIQKPAYVYGEPQIRLNQFFDHLAESFQVGKDRSSHLPVFFLRDEFLWVRIFILQNIPMTPIAHVDGVVLETDPHEFLYLGG